MYPDLQDNGCPQCGSSLFNAWTGECHPCNQRRAEEVAEQKVALVYEHNSGLTYKPSDPGTTMTTKFDQETIDACQDWYEQGTIRNDKAKTYIMYLQLFDSKSASLRKSLWKGYVSMTEYTDFLNAMHNKNV